MMEPSIPEVFLMEGLNTAKSTPVSPCDSPVQSGSEHSGLEGTNSQISFTDDKFRSEYQ